MAPPLPVIGQDGQVLGYDHDVQLPDIEHNPDLILPSIDMGEKARSHMPFIEMQRDYSNRIPDAQDNDIQRTPPLHPPPSRANAISYPYRSPSPCTRPLYDAFLDAVLAQEKAHRKAKKLQKKLQKQEEKVERKREKREKKRQRREKKREVGHLRHRLAALDQRLEGLVETVGMVNRSVETILGLGA